MESVPAEYLHPTVILDSNHESIRDYVAAVVKESGTDPVSRAVSLYYAARDGIRYDPYFACYLPEHFRASNVLKRGGGYCVCKAALLCAMGRAIGIPSRLRFADVRNHLADPGFVKFMGGSDVFVYHGITEFYLNGKWVKCTPAFDYRFCTRHDVPPLEFDGLEDSILQTFNQNGEQYMEYVADRGVYADVPYNAVMAAIKEAYGEDFIERWKLMESNKTFRSNQAR